MADNPVIRSRSRAYSDALIPLSVAQLMRRHLEAIRQALPFDAAQILVFDRSHDLHRQMAQIAYPPHVARILTEEFTRNWPSPVWFPVEPGDDLPTSISAERDVAGCFRRSDVYVQYLAPAGYLDGLTLELSHRGRYVGLANFSSSTAGFYDTERRVTASAFATLLGHSLNATAQELEAIPPTARASVITADGQIHHVPGRPHCETVEQTRFRAAIAPVFFAPQGEVAFLWNDAARWFRIVVRRQSDSGTEDNQPLLVVEQEISAPFGLTLTEIRVLTRLLSCPTNEAIALSMGVGVRTIHTHISNILNKLDCTRRGQATARAIRNGLYLPESVPEAALNHLFQ